MSSSSKVQLYLYDLSNGMAAQMSLPLTGKYFPAVWHSSIVVFGEEIYYGQGIQRCRPGQSHHGNPLKTVDLGTTEIDKDTFQDYLSSLQDVYTADSYHLLEKNCNNFTNDVTGFLTGGSIPQDVIDLPKEFLSTPFGASLRPMLDDMFRKGAGPSTQAQVPQQMAQQFASNPALSGALQQVTEAATRSQPTSNGASTGEMLASQLTVATNLASFQSILSSNRCVAVMFTGDWCGPCKVVKPVFEDLAKRSTAEPPITFVLVDTTAGREIAQQHQISAVPTFKFFLKGKQLHEIKGADAGELRTQVGILAMTAYPPHSHNKLSLPTLRAMSTSPVLSEQKPNFEAALAKLESFATGNNQATTAIATLKPVVAQISKTQLTLAQVQTFVQESQRILNVLSTSQYFPLLDICKYAILSNTTATAIAETPIDGQNLLSFILSRTAVDDLAKPTLITLLRSLCNALSSPILASSLLSIPSTREHLTQILVRALLDSDKSVRTSAGSLAYSVAGWLRKQRKDWTDEDATEKAGYGEQEEFESELLTAVLEALDREETAEVAHRLVAALGTILYLSPHFENALSPLVEALEAKRIVQSKKAILEQNVEASKLIVEVVSLVESS